MKINNWLTKKLNISYPIIQGAFARYGTADLAASVSEAGGLGIITALNFSDQHELVKEIRKVRAITENSLGINFSIIPKEINLAIPKAFSNEFQRAGMTCKDYISRLNGALDEGIKIIFTSGYDGSPIGRVAKEAGAIWIHKCVTIKHALSASRKGADAIVMVGIEGTGYKNINQNTTLINITALRRMINTPLIAAGGIGDGYGLSAALAMGAVGVYMGTAFLATKEAGIPEKWKKSIVNQNIAAPGYHRLMLGPGNHDRVIHSMASGVIQSIPSVRELMETMVSDAQQAGKAFMKSFGNSF